MGDMIADTFHFGIAIIALLALIIMITGIYLLKAVVITWVGIGLASIMIAIGVGVLGFIGLIFLPYMVDFFNRIFRPHRS